MPPTNHHADAEGIDPRTGVRPADPDAQIIDRRERDVDVTRPERGEGVEWEDDLPARELTEQERENRKHVARSLGLPGVEPTDLDAL